MSRKTPTKELRVDDLVETTIRRSSRISNNSPVPSQIITRRTSNTEASTTSKSTPVYDPEIGSKRVTRNSLSKSEDDIKPKARRASISKIKEEEEDRLTPSRRRSTRASSSSPTSKKHLEPIVATPGRRARRSLSANLADDPVEITKPATRGRKSSSNEPESATTKPSKLAAINTEEQDENKKPIVQKLKEPKISTPIKSKRRGSITEPANLEAIAEQDTENLDSAQDEVIVNSQKKVLLRKGKLDEKVPLDLSIIAEKSYSEEIDNEDVESTSANLSTEKETIVLHKSENSKTEIDKEIIVGSSSKKANKILTDTEKISGDIERNTIINVSPSEKESNDASVENLTTGSKDTNVPKLTSAKSSESSTAGKLIVDSVTADNLDSSQTKVALTNGILSEHAGEVTSSNTNDNSFTDESIIEPESKLRETTPKAVPKPVNDKLETNREPNETPAKITSTEEATVSPKQSVVCEKDRNNVSIGSDGSFEIHLEDSFSVTRNNPDISESSADEITSPSSDKENNGTPIASDTNVPRLSVGKTKSDNAKDPINTQSNILTDQKKSLNISSQVENILDSSKYVKGLITSSKDDKTIELEDEILTDRRKSYSFYEPMEVDESCLNVTATSRKSMLINNPNSDDIEESPENVLGATSNSKLTDSEEEFYLLSDTENADFARKSSLKDISKEKSLDEISIKTSVGEIAKESSPLKTESKQDMMETLIESKGSPISTRAAKMDSNELIIAPAVISAQTPDSKKSAVCPKTSTLSVRRSPRISITPTKNVAVASIEKNQNKEKTKTSDNVTPSKNDGEKFILKVNTPMRKSLSSPSKTSSEKTPTGESGGARKTVPKGNESPRVLNASTKDQEASSQSDEDSVVEVTDEDSETQDIEVAKVVVTKKADTITPSKSDGEKFILKVKTPIRGKLSSPRKTSPEKEPRRDSEGAKTTIVKGNKSPRNLNVSTKDQEVSNQSDEGSVVEVINEDSDHGNMETEKDSPKEQGEGTSSDTENENESPEGLTDLRKKEHQSKQNDVQGNTISKTSTPERNKPNRKIEAKNTNSVERTKGMSTVTGLPDYADERPDKTLNEIQSRTPLGRKVEEKISKTSPRKSITITAATLHDIQTDLNLDSTKSPEYTKNKKKSLTIPSPMKFNAKTDKLKTSTINYVNSTSEKRATTEKLNVKLDKDVDSKLDDLLLKSISKRRKDGNESSDDSDEEVHKSDNLEMKDLLAHNFGSTTDDEDYVPEEHHDTENISEDAEESMKITDLLTKTILSSSDDEDVSEPNISDDQDETDTKAGKPSRAANESSDEDEDANPKHEFMDDMAEEEEEDTPSEGSNDIIDEGESINTTESEIESDESYDQDDSFLDDSEVFELLSGEEDFLESDIAAEKATKVDVKKKSKGKTRIIRIEDSSDEEPKTECEETSQKISESPNLEIPLVEKSEDTENKNQEHTSPYKSSTRGSFVCQPPVNPEITSTPNGSLMDILNNSRKSNSRSSSIVVQENVNIDEIKDGVLIEKLQQVVQIFCSGIKSKGNLSLNVSLDYKEKSPNRDGSLKEQSFSTVIQGDDEDDVVFVENAEAVNDKMQEHVRISPQLNLSGSSGKLKGKGKRSVENLKSPVFKKDNKISEISSRSSKSPKPNEKRKHTEADDEPISAKRHSPEKLNTKQNLSGLKSADQDNDNLMNVSNRSKNEERRKSKSNKKKYADEQVQPEKHSPEKLNRKNIESDVERADQISKAITVAGDHKLKKQDGGNYNRAESAFQHYLQEKKSNEIITKPKRTPDTKTGKPRRSTYNVEVENVASTETDQESGTKVECNNETSIQENSILKIKKKRRRKSKHGDREVEIFKVDGKRRKIEVPTTTTQKNASESTWALSDRQDKNKVLIEETDDSEVKAKKENKKSKINAQFKPRLHKLLQATVIDVKNRSRRTIKPSRGSDTPDSWSTESIVIMPSTANVGKFNEPKVAFNTEKLDPKDFKNLMCFNTARVQRVETKKLLKKKGNCF